MWNIPALKNETSLLDFRREFDRFFDDFWTVPSLLDSPRKNAPWAPVADIEEEDDHYLLTLEVPGMAREDLKIEYVNGQIAISGERKQEEKNKNGRYSERRYGKFFRAFSLPAGVDGDKVEAQYANGVLKVYVPKAESAKPRQIKIGDAGAGGIFSRLLGRREEEKRTIEHQKEEKVA